MPKPCLPLRTMLVGCNGYGAALLEELLCLQSEGLLTFQAVVDPDQGGTGSRRALAAGLHYHSRLTPALEQEKPEWVVVATPIHLHAPAVIAALEHGAHVLCEKPAAGCWEDALAMQQAALRYGRQLAIGFQWAFAPAVQELRNDLAAGRLGQPRHFASCVLWHRQQKYFRRNNWVGQRQADGQTVNDSILSNATAHHLHLLMHLARRPEITSAPCTWRSALGRTNTIATCDSAVVDVDYADVSLRHCSSHCVEIEWAPLLHLDCELGCVQYHADSGLHFYPRGGSVGITYGDPNQAPFAKLRHCALALRRQEPLPCGIGDCADHLRLMQAIHNQALPTTSGPAQVSLQRTADGSAGIVIPGLAERLLACWANATSTPPSWMTCAMGQVPHLGEDELTTLG